MKFLDIDSPIGQFLCRIGDIITLNFLWIICSLPLITLGASTTALYYTWMKQYREGDSPVHRYFFSSFKDNLRKSTAAWILSLLIISSLIFDIIFFQSLGSSIGKLGQYFFTILLVCFILILLYLFPVIAAFNATLIQHFRNAFVFTLSYPLATLTLFVSIVIPVGLTYFSETYLGVWLFCWVFFGVGLLGRFQSRIFIKLFRKYLE